MTALWTVTVLLAIVAAANSVAVIALTRQVGLLHLRLGPQHRPHPGGPQPGSRLRLDPTRDLPRTGPAPDLVLLGFVRPGCSTCATVLPAFSAAAAEMAGHEKVMLVSDAGETTARDYLAAHGVSVPVITGPHLLSANGIPAVPFAVVTDGAGKVLDAHTVGSAGELREVISRARSRQATTRPATTVPRPGQAKIRPLAGDPSKEEHYVV